ncbi:hypothetical protein H6F46_06295 [Limnothrix sp. FACHB-1083]|uniref:tRNA (5-methylaminomethyl-2-thiouridine)(34)-methyltransferase MnmD n=1 Tax=unclassified Limnothrix TaxID=2632864 RepID=UPI001680A0CA|nr:MULTISPECIES: MnmC family methyltransferase [unclassified Limnothrix]MBD2160302.1 hypothetical protein [Limnothrix sp. FACHB-1083]MBD2191004.1 hypothetical protein [Limnothrix sp. FACHB-1088]
MNSRVVEGAIDWVSAENGNLSIEPTADGSVTFRSERFGETFHSRQGAWQEALSKFVEPTHLPQRATSQPVIRILDVCYGLGYNTAAALTALWALNPACAVEWVGLELDPVATRAALPYLLATARSAGAALGLAEPILGAIAQLLTDLAEQGQAAWPAPASVTPKFSTPELITPELITSPSPTPQFRGQLLWGDARQTLRPVLDRSFRADAVFLDPFSPPRCPQLWTVEFLGMVSRCLAPDGRLATYSCAAAVRSALLAAGLQLGATVPFGRRWPGTVAAFVPLDLPPLSAQEQEHLQTKAAVPYRDPHLTDDAATILDRKNQEQARSPLEPTSRWKRRWFGDCRAKH